MNAVKLPGGRNSLIWHIMHSSGIIYERSVQKEQELLGCPRKRKICFLDACNQEDKDNVGVRVFSVKTPKYSRVFLNQRGRVLKQALAKRSTSTCLLGETSISL